jgi:hypothetical protein
LAFAGALVATILCTAHSANAAEVWTVHHGDTVIYLDHGLLMKYGIAIRSGADSDIDTAHEIRLETTPSETPILVGPDNTLSDGAFHHNEGLVISTVTGELVPDDLVVPCGG